MSKYGPISRMTKTLMQPGNPYNDGTIPGSVSRRPIPSPSPMTSMLLHNMQGVP